MANPFLMNDDDESPTSNDMNSNPFLMQEEDEIGANGYMAENPFIPQVNNPFASYNDVDDSNVMVNTTTADIFPTDTTNIATNMLMMDNATTTTAVTPSDLPVDSAMSFFGTTISDGDEFEETAEETAKHPIPNQNILSLSVLDDNMGYSSEEELSRQRLPPPRPVPPSKTTQDLILSVADQLDQTSSHLLGRIPATRTPSPVSMRDLHSPSPTPEFGDFLDDGFDMPHDLINQNDGFSHTNIIGQNDNPFGVPVAVSQPPIVKQAPARPAPPRPTPPPPPRPTPPVPVAHHQPPPRPAPVQHEPDLFDMFGPSEPTNITKPVKPPPPKSNQDILSLFSSPAQPAKPNPVSNQTDLLSGDILSMDNDEDFNNTSLPPIMSSTETTAVSFVSPPISAPIQQNMPPIMSQVITQPIVQPLEIQPEPEQMPNIADEEELSFAQPVEVIPEEQHSEPLSEPIPEPNDITTSEFIHIDPTMAMECATLKQEKENILDDIENVEVASDYSAPESFSERVSVNIQPITPPRRSNEFMDTAMDYNSVTPVSVVNPFAETETISNAALSSDASSRNSAYIEKSSDDFDAFAAKFDSVRKEENSLLDGFGGIKTSISSVSTGMAWGDNDDIITGISSDQSAAGGFGNDDEDGFDSFLAMTAPEIQATPFARNDSHDSDEAKEYINVVIRPKDSDISMAGLATPILAPPPRSSQNNSIYSGDSSPRFNPFDKGEEGGSLNESLTPVVPETAATLERTDSQETPTTPLFDDDVSQPLEDFPRITYHGDGWEMQLRQPNKKKITGNRFWKKIWLRIVYQGDNPVLQLLNAAKDKEPFQELPLQACYSVSEISAQQFDQFGKIFTVKLQYIFYKERPGVRPGQVTKAERLTNKLSQFAAYAIQGDYQGVKEFGSDLKKLGLPVEHAPQVSQLFKIGSHTYEDLKQFSMCIDEHLFKYNVHRDRALNYKSEEVQLTAVDELYVEQDAEGRVMKQIARVRLFFLGFLSGMPTIELGVNDLWRQGKEVVGRHDIIPVVTEEWIRLEGVEFHQCVQQNEYERSRTIRFQPPDACYIELMRFRVRPPKNRELPFQLKAVWCVTGNKVELRADVLVPGFASRKLGQIPCEDVSIRFPIPECWIYLFRVEKHFRYGSVKSAHRRTGKIKGIERILGTVDQLQESLIEVTSGQAKYEHHHRAIVWRCPRLPKEGQGAYTTHQLVVRMALTSYDQIPEQLAPFCYVEFTMPATQVSHVTVRSVSVQDSDSDDPPEKYVRYLARHEYRVGIEHTTGESTNAYLAATATSKPAPAPIKEEPPAPSMPAIAGSDSDSDSN